MAVSFTKVNDFIEAVMTGKINLATDTLVIALSNTAPAAESSNPLSDGNGVLANVTQVAYTNLSARTLTISDASQTGGTFKLTLADLTLTATGTVATWRYAYIYSDTATNKDLIGHYDRGAAVSMVDGDTFLFDFDATNGVLQAA